MKQYRMFELTFSGPILADNWAQPDLTAVFSCGEETVTVKGFYDGEGIYKVRFLPRKTGLWRWEISGAVTDSGEELCVAEGAAHGMVKAEGTHFVFEDGSHYIPFGTTVYALTHQEDELVEKTMNTLAAAPFNKIRICVFPKNFMMITNEPVCQPFMKKEDGSWDVNRPDFNFWHRFESHLDRLEQMDIQVDLILFHPYDRWGFSSMPQGDNLVYLDTVIRRLAARPNIWWSLANEYDLLGWEMEKWYEVEEFLAKNDPYGHLLSNHNCTAAYDFTRPNITHVCLQTRWVEKAADWVVQYNKPVMFDEMCYEGNLIYPWGNISGVEMAHRFWQVCVSGAYGTHGDTFADDNNVIWWACGGEMKGTSPERIRFLRDVLYRLPGYLEPVRESMLAKLDFFTEERMAQIKKEDPSGYAFLSGMLRMDPGMRHVLVTSEIIAEGHCGEDAYLTYYGRFCPCQGTLRLPKDRTYRVEVIDAWNMTREVVMESVSGDVTVPLPSRECMAILATKEA